MLSAVFQQRIWHLWRIRQLSLAVPVIGDLAMDVISETVITESSMIGHNPDTPGGTGLGIGTTVQLDELPDTCDGQDYIVVIPEGTDYEWAAYRMNRACGQGCSITGAIVQKDDGVLIYNRLQRKIPIVDEVAYIEKIPLGKRAAVEVALPGHVIRTLSNPYGLATVFGLTPEETKRIAPIARALVGNRSAVVIRTPQGEVIERKVEAGRITFHGQRNKVEVSINDGADIIMQGMERAGQLLDAVGEAGTNVGGMLNGLRQNLADATGQPFDAITIGDLLAVDAMIPVSVSGAIAGELSMESGVAIASMVKTERVPVQKVAQAAVKAFEKMATQVKA
ncbi:diol dehydratase reactivase alpha subunit [Aneurinibacillus thermoaerophilus]|uniref:Diol dehydratase reactivase alpha subunit n=2 Tax=Aneurinibacillus thermoaerophilus TaxID=143495 RepID=A0A1G7WYC3_ANETH|nr:diol dehydratase reactivase alpha subunit [Aneurinibacillus thermoaerophilus]